MERINLPEVRTLTRLDLHSLTRVPVNYSAAVQRRVPSYLLQIPEKVMEMLPDWEYFAPFKGFRIDNLKLILSMISTHQRKDYRGNTSAQFKMKYLRNIVWNAEDYISFLKDEEKIIERIGGYIPGEQSYKYRYTENYLSPYQPSELDNQELLRKIRELNAKKGRKETKSYPRQKQQLRTMTINYEKAIELIKKEYPDKKDIKKYNYAIGQVTRILNDEPYFIEDPSGKRIHTPLTNLPKFLRSEVKIEGKYLSGIDIANSQMYFSVKSLLNPESVKEFFPGNFPLMMLKSLRLSEQKDVTEFLYLVSNAQFYKYLETEFIKEGLIFGDRLKEKIFTLIFEENHLTSKAKKIFQKHFPIVDKAFSLLRMVNYCDFVNSLARIESYAINKLIIERINTEYPNMIAQQIYDNLVTSVVTDDIETAKKIMTEELTTFVGFPPVLKVENFRPPPIF